MAYLNLLIIHHSDGSHGGEMRNGRCGSRVCGSPCVLPRLYLTMSLSFVMTEPS